MKKKAGKSGSNFLKGAFVISAAGVLVKILGAFFRVPLGNILSMDAMSYYSAAYPIYTFLIAVATAGFPTAVARLIAEYKATGNTATIEVTKRVSRNIMFAIGLASFFILFVFAGPIAKSIGNAGAKASLEVLSVGVFFCSLLSVYRGFFQGFQRMNQFAISMIIEQLVRVVVGLSMAIILITLGDEAAAAGATLGATVGGIAGFVYIFIEYNRLSKKKVFYNVLGERIKIKRRDTENDSLAFAFVRSRSDSSKNVLKRLLAIAVPITISASAIPLVGIIDVSMVVNRLMGIGFLAERARELFTMMSGYAATLINFPIALMTGLQVSVVPAVTEVFSVGNIRETKRLSRNAIKIASLISMPASLGLSVLAVPIIGLLYPSLGDSVNEVGHVLGVLSLSVFFLGGYLVSTSVYQSIGRTMIPVRNLILGIIIKIVLTYILVGVESLNIIGACIANIICYFVAWLLNLLVLKFYVEVDYDIVNTYIKPAAASIVMALVAHFSYKLFMLVTKINALSTLIAIILSVLVYAFLILLFRVLMVDDYRLLPGGRKLRALELRLFPKRVPKRAAKN